MSGELPIRFRRKAVLYATWQGRLLVFLEPDFPDIPLQVPGGTVEDNETPEQAARREFLEETGLPAPTRIYLLGTSLYRYEAGGLQHVHERHFFHLTLEGDFPETWDHFEGTPDGGGPPIRFRISWLAAAGSVAALFGGLDTFLPELLTRLAVEQS